MPQDDPVKKALDSAKKTLEGANKTSESMKVPAAPATKKSFGSAMADAASSTVKKVKDAATPKPKAPGSTLGEEAESAAKGIEAKAKNVNEYNKANPDQPLKPYKKGGHVEETGPAKLDAGETVLPAGNKKKAEKLAMEHLGKKASAMADAIKEEDADKPGADKKAASAQADEKSAEKKEVKKHKVKGIHFRHGKSGGFIAKHDLMPSDDPSKPMQSEPDEHVLASRDAMHKHIDEHFSDGEDLPTPEASEQGE